MNGPSLYPLAAVVTVAFKGFWIAGTGTSRGRDVDEVAYRDRFGCPAMPMTQVKGMLRDSAERLAAGQAGGWSGARVNQLFGPRNGKGEGDLRFPGEAGLDPGTAVWFEENAGARRQLFRPLVSTMIGELGAAEHKTLRRLEAAVPMTVSQVVTWRGHAPPDFDWVRLIDYAGAATLALGKGKLDGLGQAAVSCVEMAP